MAINTYRVEIYKPHVPECDRWMTIGTHNRFAAARAGWIYYGHMFDCSVIVKNLMGLVIYKTSFQGVSRI